MADFNNLFLHYSLDITEMDIPENIKVEDAKTWK